MNKSKMPSCLWMYVVVLALSIGLAAWGIVLTVNGGDHLILAAGCLGTLASLLALAYSLDASAQRRSAMEHAADCFNPVNERLQQISVLLNQVSEQQLISERAKAVAFREREREALRQAIREEIGRREWEAALKLIDDIEAAFGYKQEADSFREEIFRERDSEIRKVVGEGLAAIDRYCRSEQWSQALREAERLAQLFPKDAQVMRLPQDIETRREQHKQQLKEGWREAVQRHDVDGSIEILRKLDLYLTPQEAAELQETVRQVFKDKLLLLGQQFTLAVKDHKWPESVRIGETIIKEFPNSRMAIEVREKMDLLKQQASEEEAVKV